MNTSQVCIKERVYYIIIMTETQTTCIHTLEIQRAPILVRCRTCGVSYSCIECCTVYPANFQYVNKIQVKCPRCERNVYKYCCPQCTDRECPGRIPGVLCRLLDDTDLEDEIFHEDLGRELF
jgi:hypothetical protein